MPAAAAPDPVSGPKRASVTVKTTSFLSVFMTQWVSENRFSAQLQRAGTAALLFISRTAVTHNTATSAAEKA